MTKIIETANAKLNLGLFFKGPKKLADGRSLHEVISPVATLEMCNKFTFIEPEADKIEIELRTDNSSILKLKDLLEGPEGKCWRTVEHLEKITGKKLPIKMIMDSILPVPGGVGGASADMAAILRGLNKFYKLGFSLDELAKIGFSLGSDVPFCVYNYPFAHMGGEGDIIYELKFPNLFRYEVLIAIPEIKVPLAKTKTAFEYLDKYYFNIPKSIAKDLDIFERSLREGIPEFEYLNNCFLHCKLPWADEVLEVMRTLWETNKFEYVGMAGAGPTVFALYKSGTILSDLPPVIKTQEDGIIIDYHFTNVLEHGSNEKYIETMKKIGD